MLEDALRRTGPPGDPRRACDEAIEQAARERWVTLADAFRAEIPPSWVEWAVNRCDARNTDLETFLATKRAEVLTLVPVERTFRATLETTPWRPSAVERASVLAAVREELRMAPAPSEPPERDDPAVSYEGKRDAYLRAGREPFLRGLSRHTELRAAEALLSTSAELSDVLAAALREDAGAVRRALVRALDVPAVTAKWEAAFGA